MNFKKTNKQVRLYLFLFLISTVAYSQTTVNSIRALLPYLDDDNVNIKMSPGTYTISATDVASGLIDSDDFRIIEITGSNSIYDFTGVTFRFNTDLYRVEKPINWGRADVNEFVLMGNNNVAKNLTIVEFGDISPWGTALAVYLAGYENRVEGFHVTTSGSKPYGYGDMFGKGPRPKIAHNKHSGYLIHGDNNHLLNCSLIMKTYGHGIFFGGTNGVTIEGCYVEGELNTTDAVLAETGTGSAADEINFETVFGYKVPPGWKFSCQEDGIRAYKNSPHYLTGETVDTRGTTIIKNCTVKNMRSGVTIGLQNSGTKYVENVTALGCEIGFWGGENAQFVNCSGDAAVGPLYSEDIHKSNNVMDFTLLDNSTSRHGNTALLHIGGNRHNLTLKDGTTSVDPNLNILVGGTRYHHRFTEGQLRNCFDATIVNETGNDLIIGSGSTDNDVTSCGTITNNGSNNNISTLSDCDITVGCTDYVSDIRPPSNLVSGINYNYYEGEWNSLPDFDSQTPVSTGLASSINLDATTSSADYFGYTFEGYINVPNEGEYTFYTTSDDGSKLWINGNQVVSNDGLHGAIERSGDICLEAGYHKINVVYFEKTGGATLSVAYAGPGISKQNIRNLYAEKEGVTGTFTPDPSKKYYIDVPQHNLRLGATGNSEDPYTTSTSTTGDDVEWQFVSNGGGAWYIDRADGGSLPRLRTDASASADMQSTAFVGRWESFSFATGSLNNTYFMTTSGPSDFNRLQVDSDGNVNMVPASYSDSWESFRITEAGSINSGSTVVHITKRNATGFAIDGNHGGANGQNIYLWASNTSNPNQQWNEINRGGGYYSYQKVGTNYCMDGDNGGVSGQNVHLWDCIDNNYNQHWQKVSVGSGAYKLIKRNAPDFALDGNSGGKNGQNVDLYSSSSNSQDLHWVISTVNKSADLEIEKSGNDFKAFPTPFSNVLNIQLDNSQSEAKIDIISMTGKIITSKIITNGDGYINLTGLSSGIYIVKSTNDKSVQTTRIIKE